MDMSLIYSVVIPVFNSSKIVSDTVSSVRSFFIKHGHSFEVILVNDGSKDDSWSVISQLAKEYDEVKAINLLKNYGQHSANLCGFREAAGDYVITMDDDLQNPPDEIAKLIDASLEGYDLIIGKFESKQHSSFRRVGSRFVGWLNRKVFEVEDDLVLSNFRMIRRDVVDRVCKESSVSPYIPGLVLKHSSNRSNVLVKHSARAVGESNYTLRKILRLVFTILFNHSTIPLRYSAGFGFVVSGASFALGIFYLLSALFEGAAVPGWATLVVLISFFNGILILLLSIIGEYIVRALRETSNHGSYEVAEVVR